MSSSGGVLADRNRLSSQSSASSACRNSLIPPENVINESEFPSLVVRSSPSSTSSAFNSLPTTSNYSSSPPVPQNHLYSKDVYNALQRAPYANLMRTSDGNSLPTQNVEFRIQNEDFPALPGANHLENRQTHVRTANNADALASETKYSERSNTETKTGIQTFPDGTVKNIPVGMLSDQFGMAGLLTFLRAIESDPAIVALALGHDLTTLGLNLNSTERNIYATFGGPWADYPCRIQDLEAKVPDEYLTNASIRDKLPNIKLSKLSEDVLFYLFYNCPGEVYQVAAASELYSRDWRFHKGQRVWLTRSQYGGVKEQTSTYEKGSYNVFDPVQWRKIPRDMTLEYKELEERPKLPQSLQQSGQPQVAQSPSTATSQNGS
ncbi:CCR4-NOT transcription complex subunit 2 [Loa loa]|uniref:CCR4-NOT transcription complex subunit 2 n=1 Tax=Loa loa TaxID=7209 RepID=A0A1S0UMH2_LOALO|nr:CCR4-NOT transcription complex subunit 2 [Loa loa]EJD76047.1 CCR4-NOT transcription complex subunit 2 [Loa loa]